MSNNLTTLLQKNKIKFDESIYDIQMIAGKKLHRSKFQFYIERDIEQFADELETVGQILQPLVVRELNVGYYEILAGHRRNLGADINYKTKNILSFVKRPCYVIDVDDIMAEYILIKTNASREKSAWEIMYEIERLKYLIPRLPANVNEELKGRLRTHLVAESGLTASVVGRYEHMANKLTSLGKAELKSGNLNLTMADKLASLEAKNQDKYLTTIQTTDLDEFIKECKCSENTVPNVGTKKNNSKEQKIIEQQKNKKVLQELLDTVDLNDIRDLLTESLMLLPIKAQTKLIDNINNEIESSFV
jgi:Predicted transcriptional regulators